MATTGEVIKMLRARHGLTQDELGDILGVKKSAIQKYESGAIVNFKTDVLRRFFIHFNMPPWFLIFPEAWDVDNYELGVVPDLLNLNRAGAERLIQYGQDLLLIDKYRRKPLDK